MISTVCPIAGAVAWAGKVTVAVPPAHEPPVTVAPPPTATQLLELAQEIPQSVWLVPLLTGNQLLASVRRPHHGAVVSHREAHCGTRAGNGIQVL